MAPSDHSNGSEEQPKKSASFEVKRAPVLGGMRASSLKLRPSGTHLLAITLTLFGLLLRTYRLDHVSFWVDEGFSAQMAEAARVSAWLHDVHPPLYYALLSVWRTCSDSDWWLRFLSVLFGAAAIPVVYSLGRHMFSENAGLWSAALLSVLYIHVQYSQEARMYSLMVLLFACALWGLVVGAREGHAAAWIVYTVSASMLAYTQGLGLMFIVVLAALFPVISPKIRQLKDWRRWLLANSVVASVFSPYALNYAQRARGVVSGFWIEPQGPEPPIFSTLFYGTVSAIPPLSQILAHQLGIQISAVFGQWVWFAPVLVLLAFALTSVRAESRWALWSLLLAYTLPIFVLSAISLVIRPLLVPRVLLPTVVPIVLLLGSFAPSTGTRHLWRHLGLAGVFIVLLVGGVCGLRYQAKEEWRQASQFLQEHVGSTDVVLLNLAIGQFLINRYDDHGVLRRVRQLTIEALTASCSPDEAQGCVEKALRAYPPGQTVWVVEGHTLDKGVQPTTAGTWLTSHLERQHRLQLFDVSVEQTRLRY
jgi:mannosyltransferase